MEGIIIAIIIYVIMKKWKSVAGQGNTQNKTNVNRSSRDLSPENQWKQVGDTLQKTVKNTAQEAYQNLNRNLSTEDFSGEQKNKKKKSKKQKEKERLLQEQEARRQEELRKQEKAKKLAAALAAQKKEAEKEEKNQYLSEIEELMICGVPNSIPKGRDFVAEGQEMIVSYLNNDWGKVL